MPAAYTLMSRGSAVGGVFVGRVVDRVNTRIICIAGAVVIGLAFALLSVQGGMLLVFHFGIQAQAVPSTGVRVVGATLDLGYDAGIASL